MLYRFTPDGRRLTLDPTGLYSGALFLCGSHPSLAAEPLDLLSKRGVVTLAMNNAAALFRPTLWIGADRPDCYARTVLEDAGILKLARLLYAEDEVPGAGRRWRELPGTLFYGVDDQRFTPESLLADWPTYVWWKNVFVIALQVAYRLGFRTVYLAGVGFTIPKGRVYAFDATLNAAETDYNRRTYAGTLEQVVAALPHLAASGLSLVSCTPGSALNDHLPFVPFREAVERVTSALPEPDTRALPHASRFQDEAGALSATASPAAPPPEAPRPPAVKAGSSKRRGTARRA